MGTGNGIYSKQWKRRAGILTTSSIRLATVLRLPADQNKYKIADDSEISGQAFFSSVFVTVKCGISISFKSKKKLWV